MWRNWYTRTFEGRVGLPCGFKSRHRHHKRSNDRKPLLLLFMSRELARIFCKKSCKIWGSVDKSAYLRCKARVPYARQRSGKVPPKEVLKNKVPPYLYFVRHCLTYLLITNYIHFRNNIRIFKESRRHNDFRQCCYLYLYLIKLIDK